VVGRAEMFRPMRGVQPGWAAESCSTSKPTCRLTLKGELMRCFNHRDREAVGSCRACAKGLCAECAVDLGHGLSCKGPHEEIVESYSSILKFNARTVSAAPRNIYFPSVFCIAMGAMFMWFGRDDYRGLLFIMGGLFLAYGVFIFVRLRMTYARKRA